MSGLFVVTLLFVLAWAAVTGSFSLANLLFGLVLSMVALSVAREACGGVGYFRRGRKVLALAGMFLWELLLSGLRVVAMVLRPDMRVRSGFVVYPLTVDRDFEIVMLANLITLTPGTLSVNVSEDRRSILIHCVDLDDPAAVVDSIRNGFERMIMEAFR